MYAGATAEFVKNMVVARIPAVKGADPRYLPPLLSPPLVGSCLTAVSVVITPIRYLTMFLSSICSEFCNPRSFPYQQDVLGKKVSTKVMRILPPN